jgi:hypothetical protein
MKKPTAKQHTALLDKLLAMQRRVDDLTADWEKKSGKESRDDEIGGWLSAVSGTLESAMDEIEKALGQEV